MSYLIENSQSITAGATSDTSGISNWYRDVITLSDPSNIQKSLDESQLNFEYGLTPIYDEYGKKIQRNQKLITITPRKLPASDAIVSVRQDTQDIRYKNHAYREQWNQDNPDSEPQELIKRHRQDNYLSIVGNDYKLHQPRAFYEIFLKLAEHHKLELTMAGVVQDGKKIFARIKLNQGIQVRDAVIDNYLLLLTGVGVSTKGGLNPWDLACFNAWRHMLSSTSWELGTVNHKHTLPSIAFAQGMLDRINIAQQEREIQALVDAECTQNEKKEYFKNVLFPARRGGLGSWDRLPCYPTTTEASREKRDKLFSKNQETLNRYLTLAQDSDKGAMVDCDARHKNWYGAFQEAIWIADRFNVNHHSQLGSARVNSTLTGAIGNTKQLCYQFALNREAVQLRLAA